MKFKKKINFSLGHTYWYEQIILYHSIYLQTVPLSFEIIYLLLQAVQIGNVWWVALIY